MSWTNPFTNRILLDGGFSVYYANQDTSYHRHFDKRYTDIPRIVESGNTRVAPGSFTSGIQSGSINDEDIDRNKNFQSRGLLSYVTGSHNLKIGYQGQYVSRFNTRYYNDLRMQVNYDNAAGTCTATAPAFGAVTNQTWCGLWADGVTRNFDGRHVSQPLGPALTTPERIPVPNTVTTFIPSQVDEKAWFTSFYAQDQWTLRRLTISGAVRYDNAQSRFGETCVGPDVYLATSYCLNDTGNPAWGGGDGSGVNFSDITPRWGVSWDVFGTGKTAVKYSMGKYLQGSGATGIFIASNPASGGRTVTSIARVWRDLDGDRRVDCNLNVPAVAPSGQLAPNGECGNPSGFGATNNSRRWGRSPNSLDELGLAVGLGQIYCSPDEIKQPSVAQVIRNYCENYFANGGKDMFNGWGVRQNEWQMSFGVQHQLLPRLSGEVTYNWRKPFNTTQSDLIGSGCDFYSSVVGGTSNYDQCAADVLNHVSPDYDFYGIRAPLDPRLPDGGGYLIEGIATLKPGADISNSGVSAVTITPEGLRNDYWNGIDTNFVWRATNGLRVSGGTSTGGRRYADTCRIQVQDPPSARLEEGKRLRVSELAPVADKRARDGQLYDSMGGHAGQLHVQRSAGGRTASQLHHRCRGYRMGSEEPEPDWYVSREQHDWDCANEPVRQRQIWRANHVVRYEARQEHPRLQQAHQHRRRHLQRLQFRCGSPVLRHLPESRSGNRRLQRYRSSRHARGVGRYSGNRYSPLRPPAGPRRLLETT